MNPVFAIARHEFMEMVRKPTFLFATFGLPVVVVGIIGLAVWLAISAEEKKADRGVDQVAGPTVTAALAVADPGGHLGTVSEAGFLLLFPTGEEAAAAVAAGEAAAWAEVPAGWPAEESISVHIPKGTKRPLLEPLRARLRKSVAPEMDDATLARIVSPATFRWEVAAPAPGEAAEPSATSDAIGMGSGFILGFVFFFAIMSSTMHLLQAVVEEKSSRVIEVLLSVLRPTQLLFGKVLGLGSVALVQLTIWGLMGAVPIFLFSMGERIPPEALYTAGEAAWVAAYFLVGYFLFAIIMAAGGALANDPKEAQQGVAVVLIGAMLPLQFGMLAYQAGHEEFLRVLSYIPFSAPTTMMLRIGMDDVALWENALALFILVVSTWVALRLGEVAFDIGLLSAGRRIGWKTVFQTAAARRRA